MRNSLAFRFAAYFLVLTLIVQVAVNGVHIRSMLPDISNVYGFISLALSLGLIAAAAALFSRGVARDSRRLCDRVDLLPGGECGNRPASGEAFQELDASINRLCARLASQAKACRDAGDDRRAACEDAQAYLAAARGRLETIAESGVLSPGGAETAIVTEALKNLINAEQAVERARGRGCSL